MEGQNVYYPEFWKTELGNMNLILGPSTIQFTKIRVIVELTSWQYDKLPQLELICRECTEYERNLDGAFQFVHVFSQLEEVSPLMRNLWTKLPMLGWWKPNNIVSYEKGIVSLMLW
jgi:hypothetical protein